MQITVNGVWSSGADKHCFAVDYSDGRPRNFGAIVWVHFLDTLGPTVCRHFDMYDLQQYQLFVYSSSYVNHDALTTKPIQGGPKIGSVYFDYILLFKSSKWMRATSIDFNTPMIFWTHRLHANFMRINRPTAWSISLTLKNKQTRPNYAYE